MNGLKGTANFSAAPLMGLFFSGFRISSSIRSPSSFWPPCKLLNMEALFYWNLRVFDMEALAFVSKHAVCVCVHVRVCG